MRTATPSPTTVCAVFEQVEPPGAPLTTAEVAAEFDCTARTIYNRLTTLVNEGDIRTKKWMLAGGLVAAIDCW